MLYSHAELEEAKTRQGFDAFVSRVIAECLKQPGGISVTLLTAEVRSKFNNGRMHRLTGSPEKSYLPPQNGWSERIKFDPSHDDLNSMARSVLSDYYRQQGNAVRRDQIRSESRQLLAMLGEAIRSIPLKKVRGR